MLTAVVSDTPPAGLNERASPRDRDAGDRRLPDDVRTTPRLRFRRTV
jgi:hypothetical protein